MRVYETEFSTERGSFFFKNSFNNAFKNAFKSPLGLANIGLRGGKGERFRVKGERFRVKGERFRVKGEFVNNLILVYYLCVLF